MRRRARAIQLQNVLKDKVVEFLTLTRTYGVVLHVFRISEFRIEPLSAPSVHFVNLIFHSKTLLSIVVITRSYLGRSTAVV